MSKDALKCLERGWSVLGLEGLSYAKKTAVKISKKISPKVGYDKKTSTVSVQLQFFANA